MNHLKKLIREIPDWPKPGILFYDITTLMKDAAGYKTVIEALKETPGAASADAIIGIEARGFFFAPTVAHALGKGFIPVRKPNKLPAATESVEYALEYGTDRLEIHQDAIQPGMRIQIVDDVLATGGTSSAVAALIERLGGKVNGLSFLIELDFLKGRQKLNGYPTHSILHY